MTGEPGSLEEAESLRTQLQEMEDFLGNETNRLDRQAYKNCPEATRSAALTYLEEQAAAVKKNSHLKRHFEDRVDVFNAAEVVFRFFLPLDSGGPTVGKYWGAVHRIVQVSTKLLTAWYKVTFDRSCGQTTERLCCLHAETMTSGQLLTRL